MFMMEFELIYMFKLETLQGEGKCLYATGRHITECNLDFCACGSAAASTSMVVV
jgi:hypothetical protein